MLLTKPIFGQNIYEIIAQKHGFIFSQEKKNINDYKMFLRIADSTFKHISKEDFIEFNNKINGTVSKPFMWKAEELPANIFLFDSNKPQLLKKSTVFHFSKLNGLSKIEAKYLWRDVLKYKKGYEDWRSIPLSLSEPIFNENQTLAIILVVPGNSSGYFEVYQRDGENWIFLEVISSWNY